MGHQQMNRRLGSILFFSFFLCPLFPVYADPAASSPSAVNGQNTVSSDPKAGLLPENEVSLYLNLGTSNPTGPNDFNDAWNVGLSEGAGIGVGLSRVFSLILDVNHNSFPINQGNFTIIHDTASGGDISITLLMLNGKYRFIQEDNPVVPYGLLCAGAAFYNADPLTVTGPSQFSSTFSTTASNMTGVNSANFAYGFGLGLDFRLGPKIALFLEGKGIWTSSGQMGFQYGMTHAGLKLNL